MPSTPGANNAERERLRKRAYYTLNQGEERKKARQRAKRQKEGTPEDILLRRERHRQAQARYRERNISLLNLRSLQYRNRKKRQLQNEEDEAEYQRLMGLH